MVFSPDRGSDGGSAVRGECAMPINRKCVMVVNNANEKKATTPSKTGGKGYRTW